MVARSMTSREVCPSYGCLGLQHEQAAGSPAIVGDDGGLHSEPIGRSGVTFADAPPGHGRNGASSRAGDLAGSG